MKSFVGVFGLLLFLALLVWAAGDFVSRFREKAASEPCSEVRQLLGQCK